MSTSFPAPEDGSSREDSLTGSGFLDSVSLLDGHGQDLLAMAQLITDGVDTARTVVSQVLVSAGGLDPASRDSACVRTVLAVRVYCACRAAGGHGVAGPEATNESIAWLARGSAQQRSALALYLYGELRPHQVGALLGLPARVVCLLLLAALRDLAEPHPADPDLWSEAEVARRQGGRVAGSSPSAVRCCGRRARRHAAGHRRRSFPPCRYSAVGSS